MHFTIPSVGDLPGSLEKTFATKDPFKTVVSTKIEFFINFWLVTGHLLEEEF